LIQEYPYVARHFAKSSLICAQWRAFLPDFVRRDSEIWHFPDKNSTLSLTKKELLKYGLPLMLSSSISMIFNALDKLSINYYCTLSDVGVYASAMNLIAVFSIIRTSFNTLWMPSAIEHYEKNPEDISFFQKGNALISILMIVFGAIVILSKDLFVLLLGNKYQAASSILPLLMFEPIMYTISETTAIGFIVQKKTHYQIVVAGVSCIVNLIGNLLLTPRMGPQGAALSTGISYIVFFVLRTVMANKIFYVDYNLKSFISALIVLAAFGFYGSNNDFSWIQVIMFIVVIAVTIVAYYKEFVFAIKHGKSFLKDILQKN